MKKISIASTILLAATLASFSAAGQESRSIMMGSAIPATSGQRTIVLTADTKWVNVNQGEEIKFVAGASTFGWRFDGPGARSFDLQQVAPAGSVSRPVMVYIAPSPGHPAR